MTILDKIKQLDKNLTRTSDRVRMQWWRWAEQKANPAHEVEDTPLVDPRPRRLTSKDVDDFVGGAQYREDEKFWVSVMGYLNSGLLIRSPTRARLLEREIRWMRQQAAKDGLKWGKP